MTLEYLEMTPKRLIKSCIHNNEVKLKDIRLSPGQVLDSIPGINMGRQAGHSTALKEFADDNPDIHFAVIGMTSFEFQTTYRNIKNIHRVNINAGDYNNIRGRKIEYIIIENSHIFAVNQNHQSEKLLLKFLVTFAPQMLEARIFKIG